MNTTVLNIFTGVKHFAGKNSALILTIFAVGGVGTTIFTAISGGQKAQYAIDDVYSEMAKDGDDRKLTAKEKAEITWKYYIPTVIAGSATVACILGANSIHSRRRAALAGAYALSENALKEYQAKVKETFGDKKAQVVKDEIAKDRLAAAQDSQVIILAGTESLCFDTPSGRYFKSDMETLRRIQNDLNARMFSEMYISNNDIYDELGMEHLSIGDGIGFDINHNGQIKFDYSCQLTKDGKPCLVVDYMPRPKWDAEY